MSWPMLTQAVRKKSEKRRIFILNIIYWRLEGEFFNGGFRVLHTFHYCGIKKVLLIILVRLFLIFVNC